MTKDITPIKGQFPLCGICKTRICHPATGICLTCRLDEVGGKLAEGRESTDVSVLEFMSLIRESHCKTEMHIRITCPPVPGREEVVLSYEKVKYHIGWWDKPRIRIPRFLAGWLERFNCVFTEYVDCKVAEDGEPVA